MGRRIWAEAQARLEAENRRLRESLRICEDTLDRVKALEREFYREGDLIAAYELRRTLAGGS